MIKMLLNSLILTRGAKFMTLDIRDFYLNTPMEKPEYARIKIGNFPKDMIDQYRLNKKVVGMGTLHTQCAKRMYGLPHARIIAQKLLEECLNNTGYSQSDMTPQ